MIASRMGITDILKPEPITSDEVVVTEEVTPKFLRLVDEGLLTHIAPGYYAGKRTTAESSNLNIISEWPLKLK